jgi:HEAT repeat protein
VVVKGIALKDFMPSSLVKETLIAVLIFFFLLSCTSNSVEFWIDELQDNQYEAAKALAKIKDVKAVEPLIAALKDEKCSHRWIIAYALGEIKDSRAVEPLIAQMVDGKVDWNETMEALVKINDSRAVELLIALVVDRKVSWYDVPDELLEINESRTVELLIAALKDEDSRARSFAAGALGDIKNAT